MRNETSYIWILGSISGAKVGVILSRVTHRLSLFCYSEESFIQLVPSLVSKSVEAFHKYQYYNRYAFIDADLGDDFCKLINSSETTLDDIVRRVEELLASKFDSIEHCFESQHWGNEIEHFAICNITGLTAKEIEKHIHR